MLLINMLINNVGFYMLIPYLATHMTEGLGLAAWLVGLILGVRNFSQQGLFLIGGSLSDRIGHKPVIVVGCMLRSVGFVLFAFVDSAPGLLFASALSGVAAAFSTPSARSYLTHAAGGRRVEAFAFLTMGLTAASLLGPLIGVALLAYDFRLVALAAGGTFAVLAVIQFQFLPPLNERPEANEQSVLEDWREVVANRPFILFSIAMIAFLALGQQIYLGVPLESRRVTGSDAGLAALLTISGILSIVAQLPLTTWSQRRWSADQSIVIGMALNGIAFVPLVLLGPLLPVSPDALGPFWLRPELRAAIAYALNLTPLMLTCALLTISGMLAMPYIQAVVTMFGGGRLAGTYVGMYYLVQGIGAALSQMGAGAAFDAARVTGIEQLPWLTLTVLGLASAGGVAILARRGMVTNAGSAIQAARA